MGAVVTLLITPGKRGGDQIRNKGFGRRDEGEMIGKRRYRKGNV